MVRSASGPPTATIDDVPPELVDRFCSYSDVPTLRSLRLSNKALNASATRALFRTVELLPTEESAERCGCILASDSLRDMVTHFGINTSLTPENEDMDANNGWPDERKLPLTFEALLMRLGEFEKLKHVSLRYSRECVAPRLPGEFKISVPDTAKFRHMVLKRLLVGINSVRYPAKLASLTIMHLQNLLDDDVAKHPDFNSLLSGLTSLALQTTIEFTEHVEDDDKCPELGQFFRYDLPYKILAPALQNLQHLKLYSRVYWGYFPFCNLFDLHFPNLRSLALGNYTFFCDAQLDWITSHADTLQSLVLDDCAILPVGRVESEADHPPGGPELYEEDGDLIWDYPVRWNDYFSVIADKLHELRHLGFGQGLWAEHRQLEETDQVGVEIRGDRYLLYDACMLPRHFFPPSASACEDEDGKIRPPGYDSYWSDEVGLTAPQCDDDDKMTLGWLLDILRNRKGGSNLRILEPSVPDLEESVHEEEDDSAAEEDSDAGSRYEG